MSYLIIYLFLAYSSLTCSAFLVKPQVLKLLRDNSVTKSLSCNFQLLCQLSHKDFHTEMITFTFCYVIAGFLIA